MRRLFLTTCLLGLSLGSIVQAQEIPVEGISLGLNEQVASSAIEAACNSVSRIEVANTRFPAANDSEVHLRCVGLTLENGDAGGDAVFTFADDALIMFQARGDAQNMRPDKDPDFSFSPFDIFMADMMVINTNTNTASIFTDFMSVPLVLHWNNPAWTSDHISAPTAPFFLPPEIQFGASQDDMTVILEDACEMSLGRPIDEVWLATEPGEQFQIDCYGYEIAGYPRKLEFIFGDGVLQQMWIMFDHADIPRLRAFLTAEYGDASQVGERYEIFDDWRLALRKDTPEIRMVSDEIAGILASENQ